MGDREKCPHCGNTNLIVARNVKGARTCLQCHFFWIIPQGIGKDGGKDGGK